MIIGLTGSLGAGKSRVSKFFIKKGFIYLVFSDILREELEKRNMGVDRKNLQDMGNELRMKFGNGILAKKLVEKMGKEDYLLDGVRNLGEVNELRKLENFKLICVHASPKKRYENLKDRGSERDPQTWEEFLKMDRRDFSENIGSGQQVGKCMKEADFKIVNDSTLEELENKLNALFEKLKC